MGLDLRVVGAPALATCVHVSLVFAKQALLPALLGDAYSPAALAILLGRLALCSAASALVCVPLATAAAAASGHISTLNHLNAQIIILYERIRSFYIPKFGPSEIE